MAKGFDWGNNSHPEKCECGHKRKPKETFQRVAGRFMCKDCVRNMQKGVRR